MLLRLCTDLPKYGIRLQKSLKENSKHFSTTPLRSLKWAQFCNSTFPGERHIGFTTDCYTMTDLNIIDRSMPCKFIDLLRSEKSLNKVEE